MRFGIKGVFLSGVLGAVALSASFAFAQPAERHPVLKKFEENQGKIDFLGNAYGMDGWIVTTPEGRVITVYTNPQGGLVSGMLFGPDGVTETQKQLESYHKRLTAASQEAAPGADKSAASRSEKLYAEAEKSSWVSIGDAKAPYLYMFVNVNCDHCQSFWKDIEAPVAQGKLQVRLVPYGEAPANREGAAALLSVEHPDQAWKAYVGGDKSALAKDKAKDEAFQKVEKNTTLAKTWKLAPPFTLYRRPADGVLTAVAGKPDNPMLLLAEFLK